MKVLKAISLLMPLPIIAAMSQASPQKPSDTLNSRSGEKSVVQVEGEKTIIL